MWAHLNCLGTQLLDKDELIIAVMSGRSLRSHVGTGSKVHDLSGDFSMIDLTSSSVARANLSRTASVSSSSVHGYASSCGTSSASRVLRIFLIFSMKNALNLPASSRAESV